MTRLKRSLNWQVFSLYGLGNILGAGIYVLVGEVAREAGRGLIWSLVLAAITASFTAITYSALASKYPLSAGAAVYTERAFGSKRFSTIIGLSLAFTGVVSAGALLRGFDNYFQDLVASLGFAISPASWLVILITLGILGLIALKGIRESAAMVVLLTLLEVGGLLLIIFVGFYNANSQSVAETIYTSTTSITHIEPMAIILGALVAFYAFIGFEDMVNVAEEVKQPKTSIKRGMLIALIVATVLYIATAIATMSVLFLGELSYSKAPLADVFRVATGSKLPVISIIGLFAVINGVLAQIIMSSRVLYGLSREGWIPKYLSNLSANKVPVATTVISLIAIATGALLLPLASLAQITSLGLLIIFSVVQVAALKLIRQQKISLNKFIPIAGLLLNIFIICVQVSSWAGIV